MHKLDDNNFLALHSFAKTIKNDLASGNKHIIIVNVNIKYTCPRFESEINTQVIISLDSYPFASLKIIDKDWLTSVSVYVEFLTGYNEFSFDEKHNILIIRCQNSPKLGPYTVEFKEL